jgi:phage-related protein
MAAASTGREVGRVSIRVLPNSTKFRDDLRAVLTRVEATMTATLRIEADTRQADRTVDKLRDRVQRGEANLQVDANVLAATAQLARVSRDRIVNLRVNVPTASLAKAGAALAALSGGRAVGSMFADIGRGLGNLDKSLPKIALLSTGIASLASAALSSGAGLITLGGGLAQIGALGLVLPGIFAAAAVGITVLAVALKSAPEQLAPLKAGFLDLGKTIDSNFWDRARDPIIGFVTGVLPQLQDGFAAVANSMGEYAARLSDSFAQAFGNGRLAGMFGSLAQSVDVAAKGTDGFASSIAILGTLGASYLPRLAQFFVDIGDRFNAFISAAEADGRLNLWVENGISALGQLGSALGSIASIFAGINSAAVAAGGGGLASFAAVLGQVADIINGPAFQEALTTIFQGASAGFSALGSALVPIGDAIAALAPTIAGVLTTAGEALGGLLSSVAGALAQPAFAEGLTAFFAGIKTGMDAIGPALPAVAEALGSLGSFAGQLAGTLGSVLAAALEVVAPLLTQLLDAAAPLIPVLGDQLISVLQELGPSLQSSLTELLPVLVEAILAIVPALGAALPFLGEFVAALAPIAAQLIESLIPALVAMTPAIIAMLEGLTPLLQLLPLMTLTVQALAAVISTVLVVAFGIMQTVWTAFTALITGNWDGFSENILGITKGMGDSIGGIWQGIVDAVTGIVTQFLPKILEGLRGVESGVTGFFSGAGDWLVDAGSSIIQGLIDGINGMIGLAKDAASGVMEAISNFFPHSPAKEGPFSGRGWTLYSGRATMEGFAAGMESRAALVRRTAASTLALAAAPAVPAMAITTPTNAPTAGSWGLDGTPVQLWIEGKPFSGMIGTALAQQERVTNLTQLAGRQVV